MSKKINIDTLSKNIILELLSHKYNKIDKFNRGRPSKCTKEYYLDKMFYVLKEGIGWNYIDDNIIKGDTVRKMFNKWTKDEIFKDAWIIILNIYSFMKLDFKDIFIDASHIKNVLGSEMVGPNHYDRYRPGTKLSIICDDLGIPISIQINKSSLHDSKFINNNLQTVPIDISSSKFLIGDKGYIGKR